MKPFMMFTYSKSGDRAHVYYYESFDELVSAYCAMFRYTAFSLNPLCFAWIADRGLCDETLVGSGYMRICFTRSYGVAYYW